jgi:AcrR family transcriptional regulator
MATALKTLRKPRLSRADQKAKRIETMLEAAWALFREKGYESSTMDEVAEIAGVSRYPVYYAFGDKQNLFFELWKSRVVSVLDTIESRVKHGAPLKANLKGIAQWVVDEHTSNPYAVDGLFFVVQTIGLSRADIAKKLQATSKNIVDHIAEIIASSTLESGQQLRAPARAVATHLIGMVNGLANMRSEVNKLSVNTADLLETFLVITTRSKGR